MFKKCPKCGTPMHFLYGKIWWCGKCRIAISKTDEKSGVKNGL